MSTEIVHPVARRDGLVVATIADETLVYDLERNRAYCLNAPAGALWRACTGDASIDALSEATALPADAVSYGLSRLRTARLVAAASRSPDLPRLTRRMLLRKLGAAGAVVAIPTVLTLLAPSPLAAASCMPTGASCTSDAECCSGTCSGLVPRRCV